MNNLGPLHYHDTETTQSVSLGTPYRQDSTERVWKYAENGGTAIGRGKLAVTATQEAQHIDLAPAVAAAGAQEITLTLGSAAAAADLYKDGYAVVQDNTGEGVLYIVEGHGAIESAGSGVIRLVEPLVAAIDTTTDIDLIKNKYKDVVISVTDQVDVPVGVFNVNVAADAFGMIQTWGPAAVWHDEANAIGDMLVTGTGTAGQVETEDAVAEPLVGMAGPVAGADADYQMIFLKLEP